MLLSESLSPINPFLPFMLHREPEGYKKLLAYQKAKTLHVATSVLAHSFPKTKTYADLADQMIRSARSGNKNIVEGWKRNTTKEYFDFLGFCIGAVEELKDDAEDIVLGVYPELMKNVQVMGERGIQMGKERDQRGEKEAEKQRGIMRLEELVALRFYPLDMQLPAIVILYLQAKELNFLLHKLQQSLDVKMDKEMTKPVAEKLRSRLEAEKQADKEWNNIMKSLGSIHLENGQYISKEEWEKRGHPALFPD